ncbi:MAG: hypothetical protein DRO23_01855 [Thermoprotei archaeon]|nr:MAG: hypothetical protein DRO23_01855 [Thermoprotei archaeon]
MVKIVVLDLDMTLIDTLERFFIVYNTTREIFGLNKISKEEFMHYFKNDMLDPIIPENINKMNFWKTFRTLYGNVFTHKDKPIEGAIEVLKWLKKNNYRVIVTTGREIDPEKIWAELKEYNMAEYVDEVYTIKQQKPEDEHIPFSRKGILNEILQKYGVNPEDVVFVGDYWVDMEAGKAVGVKTVGVLTGLKTEELLRKHGADIVINGIWDLPKVLSSFPHEKIAESSRHHKPEK